jgi:hypothetical protein
MKTAFKRGLIKAATSTNAWIITGGTNTGVMRLVGEAVSEEFNKLIVIGIATWGKIALRKKLIVSDEPLGVFCDFFISNFFTSKNRVIRTAP